MNEYSTHDFHEVLDEIRWQGLRITEPRKAIIKYLMVTQTHPTIEEIHNVLKSDYPNLSLATVYNNLNFLVDAGFVYEMKFSNTSSRYDFMGHRHHHILCDNCGAIADFQTESLDYLDETVARQTDYLVYRKKLEYYGLCPRCQKSNLE